MPTRRACRHMRAARIFDMHRLMRESITSRDFWPMPSSWLAMPAAFDISSTAPAFPSHHRDVFLPPPSPFSGFISLSHFRCCDARAPAAAVRRRSYFTTPFALSAPPTRLKQATISPPIVACRQRIQMVFRRDISSDSIPFFRCSLMSKMPRHFRWQRAVFRAPPRDACLRRSLVFRNDYARACSRAPARQRHDVELSFSDHHASLPPHIVHRPPPAQHAHKYHCIPFHLPSLPSTGLSLLRGLLPRLRLLFFRFFCLFDFARVR